jgi:hypothetical protein
MDYKLVAFMKQLIMLQIGYYLESTLLGKHKETVMLSISIDCQQLFKNCTVGPGAKGSLAGTKEVNWTSCSKKAYHTTLLFHSFQIYLSHLLIKAPYHLQ